MTSSLTSRVSWIGYVDWPVRDFHGYKTKRGSTYNAYLVKGDDAVAVIDTVKIAFAETFIEHIKAETSLERVRYIVCNHAEPDHAGSLSAVIKVCPNAELVCNAKCKNALDAEYDTTGWRFKVIKEGDTLDLGGQTLQFFDTVMVHWPESMVTYLQEEKLLFSMDAFGQHYACSSRFDDEVDLYEVMQEAKTYYANIVLPFARPVGNAIQKLGTLDIKMIAPSHGIIWRTHLTKILSAYADWRISKPSAKVVVFYSTMWQSTRKMAEAIVEGVKEIPSVEFKLIDLNATHDTEIITEIMDCAAFAAGSPTLNQGCMPRMAACMTYIRGLKPAGKKSLAFGSFGWASRGAEEVADYLSALGAEQIQPPLTCRYTPTDEVYEACRQAGRALAEVALAVE